MKITTVWIKYPERFAGEYAPNLHAAVDEWTNDENPAYIAGQIDIAKHMLARGDIADYSVAEIEVDDKWINGLFARQATQAKVS